MIVCHCKVVTDQAVSRVVDAGACSLGQVCRSTGAGTDCGGCVFAVKHMLCQHEESTAPASFLEVEGAAS